MPSIVQRLHKSNLIHAPEWLHTNVHYETMMGSVAYGVSNDTSDVDIYGFAIPQKHVIFPHLAGEIPGFGTPHQRFEQYQEHHILEKDSGKEYDLSIYSIVKYFQLAMENNPNMIDSLFTPVRCIRHITTVGQMVRDNRHLFLHKGAWHKFKGYAYAQLHKAEIKTPQPGSKRAESVSQFGWDVKFGYHIVRLIHEAQQILEHHDLDLEQNREHLKAIRKGEVSLGEVKRWFSEKESELEKLYISSNLRHSPDEEQIKQLLINCLEHHYGSLSEAVVIVGNEKKLLQSIKSLLDKAGI